MEPQTILLDSSILIEFFRKQNKSKSVLFHLTDRYRFCISVITMFEIQIGIKSERQQHEHQILMKNIHVLPLDQFCIETAVTVHKNLTIQNTQIGLADLLISATAIHHSLPVATLNQKHFKRIPNLKLIE